MRRAKPRWEGGGHVSRVHEKHPRRFESVSSTAATGNVQLVHRTHHAPRFTARPDGAVRRPRNDFFNNVEMEPEVYTRKPAVHARTNFMRPFAEAPAPPEWKGHVRATLMRESKKLQSFKAKTVGRPYRPSLLVSEYLLPMLTNTSHPTPRTHLAPIK